MVLDMMGVVLAPNDENHIGCVSQYSTMFVMKTQPRVSLWAYDMLAILGFD